MSQYPESAQAKAAYLNKKFKDIKMRTFLLGEKLKKEGGADSKQKLINSFSSEAIKESINVVNKEPNAVMNDYTKNISESIFTPGVFCSPKKVRLHDLMKHKRQNYHSMHRRSL